MPSTYRKPYRQVIVTRKPTMAPRFRLVLHVYFLVLAASFVTATPSLPLSALQTRAEAPQPEPDCALVDCADGRECVIINKTAACIPIRRPPDTPRPGPQCGTKRCPRGQECCNPSCGICTAPGKGCIKLLCRPEPESEGPRCGPNVCARGEYCCNESCGYCRKPGQACTEEFCMRGPKCGPTQCVVGEVCCNDSCGYCRKPEEPCTVEYCLGPR